jgi:hypothetical protein
MTDWVVHYRSITLARDLESASSPTKEGALKQAAALMRKGHEVHRIEGSNGEKVGKEEIKRWVADHPLN